MLNSLRLSLGHRGADRRKFWAIQKVPDALKSGSRGLTEKPFVGIGRCTECGIVYNSASKKTNGQNSQMKNLSSAAW